MEKVTPLNASKQSVFFFKCVCVFVDVRRARMCFLYATVYVLKLTRFLDTCWLSEGWERTRLVASQQVNKIKRNKKGEREKKSGSSQKAVQKKNATHDKQWGKKSSGFTTIDFFPSFFFFPPNLESTPNRAFFFFSFSVSPTPGLFYRRRQRNAKQLRFFFKLCQRLRHGTLRESACRNGGAMRLRHF